MSKVQVIKINVTDKPYPEGSRPVREGFGIELAYLPANDTFMLDSLGWTANESNPEEASYGSTGLNLSWAEMASLHSQIGQLMTRHAEAPRDPAA